MTRFQTVGMCALLAAGILVQGCAKKKVATNVPPAPQAEKPVPVTVAKETPPPRREPQSSSVAAPASQRTPDEKTRQRIDELLARISDAYFDYDRHTLRPDAVQALQGNVAELRNILKEYPEYKLTIEGYCDERGSAEYNLGLGDARAKAAREYLVQVGIPGGQLGVVSYGNEKQTCQDHNESCWQKNRRIHIIADAR